MTAKKQLSNELFEITTGLLLGDGNLQKPRTCVRYRFRFAQEATRKDYVLYLFDKYREYIKHPERGVKVAQRFVNEVDNRYKFFTSRNLLFSNRC